MLSRKDILKQLHKPETAAAAYANMNIVERLRLESTIEAELAKAERARVFRLTKAQNMEK